MLLHSEDEAMRELAQAWKAHPGAGDACEALRSEQVRCFGRRISLSLIRQLDRPGVLKFDADTAHPSWALLTGLSERSATLRAAGSEQTVTLAALAQRWQGDFATLWRTPPGYDDRADGVPARAWIAQHVGAPAGKRTSPDLRADIRAFQVANGLPVDGNAGQLTFMQLNRAGGVDEPRLAKAP